MIYTISKKYKAFVVAAIFAAGIFYFSPQTNSQDSVFSEDIYRQIKEEVKREVYTEIKKELYDEFYNNIEVLVQREVKNEFEKYLARQQGTFDQHVKSVEDSFRDPLELVVHNTVHDVLSSMTYNGQHIVTDNQLEETVAGYGIESELPIGAGFNKTPSKETALLLAKNEARQTLKDGESDDVTGGTERAESIERTLQQRGSILLPKGTLQVEPSITWAHLSSNRINIQGFSILPVLVIGDISTEEVKRDIFIQNFAMKFGLLHNLQAEVKVPFRAQYERITVSEIIENTRSTAGIGDIEFGLSRQIGWEKGFMPDLIAAISVKSNTGKSPYNRTIGLGTGHWAVRSSLIAAKSSDPAVIFGSTSFTYNFEETIENFGKIKPGNSLGYSLGMAIALSYQTALNLSFDHSVTQKMERDGRTVSGSFLNSANVKLGANWALNEKSSVDFGVAFGVTDDAPDVTVELRFPYTF